MVPVLTRAMGDLARSPWVLPLHYQMGGYSVLLGYTHFQANSPSRSPFPLVSLRCCILFPIQYRPLPNTLVRGLYPVAGARSVPAICPLCARFQSQGGSAAECSSQPLRHRCDIGQMSERLGVGPDLLHARYLSDGPLAPDW